MFSDSGGAEIVKRKSRPKVLVIAPHLPRYDKYSGDLRLFRLLEILLGSHDIVFLALAETGEGPHEEKRYLASLEKLNVTAYVRDYSLVKVLRDHEFQAAIIEFYYTAEHHIPRIRILQPKCRVIVDTVDIHYRRAYSKYGVTKNPEDLAIAEKTKREETGLYRQADVIVTVTDEDAEVLSGDCPGLTVRTIPNIHDPSPAFEENGNRNLLFVGGFNHDPNVDAVLYFCDRIFPQVRRSVPECSLTVVGSNPPEQIRRLKSACIRIAGFVPSLAPIFRNSYISVAPLRFGAGMKGKVGEAMSEGLPVVTTSIGAQGMGLLHRHNAMICDSPTEFADSVVELIRNRKLYEEIRRNALEHIVNMSGTAAVEKRVGEMMGQLENIKPKQIRFLEKVGIAARFLRKAIP
jgi:glycosyltransferase involved in cell wall biosynthesis